MAKQAAWEQEQARIQRERHAREAEEFKASEALAGNNSRSTDRPHCITQRMKL